MLVKSNKFEDFGLVFLEYVVIEMLFVFPSFKCQKFFLFAKDPGCIKFLDLQCSMNFAHYFIVKRLEVFSIFHQRDMDLYVALIASSCLTLWSETDKLLNKLGLLGRYGHQWKFGTNCISLKNYTPIIVICYNMTSSFRVCSKGYKVHVSGDLKILY